MAMSPSIFRQVLGRFATGVTIVTLKNETGIHGLTINSFTSVSLEPTLILVCIKKDATSHTCLTGTDSFVVNILSQEQEELSNVFATPQLTSAERFKNASYAVNDKGIPVFDHNLGHLECRIVNEFSGGDHTIFLAEVEDLGASEEGSPLLFYRGRYAALDEIE